MNTSKESAEELQPPIDEGWGGRFVSLQDPDKYRFFFVTWTDKDAGNTLTIANKME